MSLINQMLQELDARRSEVSGNDLYGQQVRAVPQPRGIHPAWWLALVLAVMLAGVVGWLLWRAPLAPLMPKAQVVQPEAATSTAQEKAAPVPAPVVPELVPAPIASAPASPPVQAPSKVEDKTEDKAKDKPEPAPPTPAVARPVQESPVTAAPPETRNIAAAVKEAQAKALQPQPKPAAQEPVPPVVPRKEIKQLTPAQQAENSYRKALSFMQQGNLPEAISGMEQALRMDARHAGARQALVGALLESKRPDDALRAAREGLEVDASQSGLAMVAARLQVDRGDLSGAIAILQRSLPHAVERADYQAFLAALLQRDGQHKEAVEHYLLCLQKAPENGVWWMGLGISLQADNRAAEAQEAFRRAKASNALSPELLAFVESRLRQLRQ